MSRAVFTSMMSHEDAARQAQQAGYTPVGTGTKQRGGRIIYVVFAEGGAHQFKSRAEQQGALVQNKIWG